MLSNNPAYISADDNCYEYITDDRLNQQNSFQSETRWTTGGVR